MAWVDDGRHFRVQWNRGGITYNGDPWQYCTVLDTLEASKRHRKSFQQVYGYQCRIVEQINKEIYDVVPEESARS